MNTLSRPSVALAFLVALAACSRAKASPPDPTTTSAPSHPPAATAASASAAPTPPAEPDPTADFHSLDEAKADASPIGKTVFARIKRGTTDASTFSGYSCERGAHAPGKFQFTAADVDLVRALPTEIVPKSCPRVLGKVVGRSPISNDPVIALTKIYDVSPEAPEKPADGADFANIDDVHLAGRAAVGKVVQLSIWRGELANGKFPGYDCRRDATLTDFVNVTYAAPLAAKASSIGTGGFPKKCTTVRLKLTALGRLDWTTELLDVK